MSRPRTAVEQAAWHVEQVAADPFWGLPDVDDDDPGTHVPREVTP